MVKAVQNDRELEFELKFTTTTFGKWILVGEHAVVRGQPAIAFPLLNRSLTLTYDPGPELLSVDYAGKHGDELRLLFYGVLENATERLRCEEPLRGHFRLDSSLPVGAGLGASAALCGAVARWCVHQGWMKDDHVFEFARQLEDLFHGESSGLDTAVSLAQTGVYFVRGKERRELRPAWWPNLYISYSGQRGMTSDCVNKVKGMFETEPSLAKELDARMTEAVQMTEGALTVEKPDSWEIFRRAITMANDCFTQWGLSTGELKTHLEELRLAGAAAVKPTGSGGGGYVLSLWENEPPEKLRHQLVLIPQPQL